jgi:hypothetical protein
VKRENKVGISRLVVGMKENELGGPCSTYSRYRNKDGFYEIINNKLCVLNLSGPG